MSKETITKDELDNLLYRYVSSNNSKETAKLLNMHTEIDASENFGNPDDNGVLFGLAMQKSSELLAVLISAYVNKHLQGDKHSLDYIAAKHRLGTMLEQQIDESVDEFEDLPGEMQKILAPWMPKDTESDADIKDLEIAADLLLKEGSEEEGHYTSDTDSSFGHSDHEERVPLTDEALKALHKTHEVEYNSIAKLLGNDVVPVH